MKKLIIVFVALIVVAIGFIFLRPGKIISKEEAKAKFKLENSRFLQWRGGDVHYVDEGSGFPVLMIHGLAGSLRNFGKIAGLLQDDFRIIRVDLPGFGLSDMPQVDPANPDYRQVYRDFFKFFLDTLNLDSFYLMGNSMGGWVAWEMAADHPEKVKKLVLCASAGYDTDEISRKVAPGLRTPVSGIIEKIAEKGIPLFITEKNVEKCFADLSKINKEEVKAANGFNNREGNVHVIFELVRHRQDADTSRIGSISCPTLIVWGKDDNLIPVSHASRFHRDIKGSKLILYENCGHIPMLEKAEQFEKDFLEFVKG